MLLERCVLYLTVCSSISASWPPQGEQLSLTLALSTTMLWLKTVKNKESSKAWTETMSQSYTCFHKLFLSSILSQWQILLLESETAIFPTSWSRHSTLNQALIVSNYQDVGDVCYLLMSPGLWAVQVTHIKWYFSLCKTECWLWRNLSSKQVQFYISSAWCPLLAID